MESERVTTQSGDGDVEEDHEDVLLKIMMDQLVSPGQRAESSSLAARTGDEGGSAELTSTSSPPRLPFSLPSLGRSLSNTKAQTWLVPLGNLPRVGPSHAHPSFRPQPSAPSALPFASVRLLLLLLLDILVPKQSEAKHRFIAALTGTNPPLDLA